MYPHIARRGLLATGIVALAALQPAQAAPVEYVKVCSLYGAGYYYMPGTDICMKIGGYVRHQAEFNSAFSGVVFGSSFLADAGRNNRISTPDYSSTTMAIISIDTRQQTAYGTLRTYFRMGLAQTSLGTVADAPFTDRYFDRGFIQIAGFTFGRASSMFDIFTNTDRYSYSDARTDGSTQRYGAIVAAYTAMLPGGFSATISAEDSRSRGFNGVGDGTTAIFAINGVTTKDTANEQWPDLVANLRVDQPWGHFGISGALHQVRGGFYGVNTLANGHPGDKWGWAAAIGGMVNLPGGDSIGVNFVYSRGASIYATRGGNWQMYNGTSSVGVGWLVDGIFDNTTGTRTETFLTDVWSINVGGEHRWTPQLATSLYGGYTKVSYGAGAQNVINLHFPGAAGTVVCGVPVAGAVWPPLTPPTGSSGAACSPNFSFWQAGSRTQWTTMDGGLRLGFDVFYTHLNTAYRGSTTVYGANGAMPAVTGIDNQNILSAIFRIERIFLN